MSLLIRFESRIGPPDRDSAAKGSLARGFEGGDHLAELTMKVEIR
jgi:hypothetical protein